MNRMVYTSALMLLMFSHLIVAQQFDTPRPSPKSTVTQVIGVTEATIHYCRPGVKGRVIWGDLVPYNQVWRTGANEVTSITLSDPVKVNGNKLDAGTYGIHSIPAENEWTIMFSGNTQVGGSSTFNEENVVLRLNVKPQETTFKETMTFVFMDVTENSAEVVLLWDKLKVGFTVETDTEELTLSKARNAMNWRIPFQAANYCLQKDLNLDEALNWIQASVLMNENYWNMRIKAQLLANTGSKAEAITVMEKAIEHGNKMSSPPFDFDSMKNMLADWKK